MRQNKCINWISVNVVTVECLLMASKDPKIPFIYSIIGTYVCVTICLILYYFIPGVLFNQTSRIKNKIDVKRLIMQYYIVIIITLITQQ